MLAAAGRARERYFDTLHGAVPQSSRPPQRKVRVSELGHECSRYLLHTLAGSARPTRPQSWKASVGTAVHSYLEALFERGATGDLDRDEWVTEWRTTVFRLNGQDSNGVCDLIHLPTKAAIDHKLVSKSQLMKAKLKGPTQQQRVQVHGYALGISEEQLFGSIERVAICFLPRDGELSDAFWFEEAYDPTIPQQAIKRLRALSVELEAQGLERSLSKYDPCSDAWCPWCAAASLKPVRTQAVDLSRITQKKQQVTPAPVPAPASAGIPALPLPRSA